MTETTDYRDWLFHRTPVLASTLDANGKFVDVSDALAKRLGFRPADLIGRGPLDLATPASADRIRREYRPIMRRCGALENVNVEFVASSGEIVELLVNSVVHHDSIDSGVHTVSVYVDLGQVAWVQRRFRKLYRATPAMLYSMSVDGRIREVSERWLHKLGYAREEVIGRSAADFLSDATREQLLDGSLEWIVDAKEYTNHPREMVTKSGEIKEVLMSAVAERDEQGNVLRHLIALSDVTKRNRAERQLRKAFEENARLRRELEYERDYLREEVAVSLNFGEIVGSSPALQSLLQRMDAVAQTNASVLIIGESGTGKELIAHAIHSRSERSQRPMVKVNCASIPHDLFESEFFGHVKGAFTGAHRDRVGRFQLANCGTIFLDEVGEIPIDLQGKLLRVLQEQEFERVGDDRTRSVDVRVIAATNQDLEQAVADGRFREDLFYRLSVFPIEVPPLRARGDDVLQIAQHLIQTISQDMQREPAALTRTQSERLRQYQWPGNVRELKNTLERGIILSRNGALHLDLHDAAAPPGVDATTSTPELPGFVTAAEFRERDRANLIAALEHANWRVAGPNGAAALLGLKPSTLQGRMQAFEIERPARRRGRPRKTQANN